VVRYIRFHRRKEIFLKLLEWIKNKKRGKIVQGIRTNNILYFPQRINLGQSAPNAQVSQSSSFQFRYIHMIFSCFSCPPPQFLEADFGTREFCLNKFDTTLNSSEFEKYAGVLNGVFLLSLFHTNLYF
jgi:hypothetical protein